MRPTFLALSGVTIFLGAACSSPSLTGTTFSCQTSADCTGGLVCTPVGTTKGCVAASTAPLRIGMSAALKGSSGALGTEMKHGIDAAFKAFNAAGGVNGRELVLDARDDNYDPMLAVANVNSLIDFQAPGPPDMPDMTGPNKVIALLGDVGTPTMLTTFPIAIKNGVVFFAPFTGAQKFLRDGTNSKFSFNYRAGYNDETEAMVDYITRFRTPRITDAAHIMVFAQNDGYGDAGYKGVAAAYNKNTPPLPPAPTTGIKRIDYDRADPTGAQTKAAAIQAEAYLEALPPPVAPATKTSVAIAMIDTYQAASTFIRLVKLWLNENATRANLYDLNFINVSFVGADALAAQLKNFPDTYPDVSDPMKMNSYAQGVMVTQVVPYYLASSPAAITYRKDIMTLDQGFTFNFTSFEGHLAARLFIEGIKANGPVFDGPTLAQTFETKVMNADLGIQVPIGFSSINHQGLHTVWFSTMKADATFDVSNKWDPVTPGHISPN